jgi:hypothetical protein
VVEFGGQLRRYLRGTFESGVHIALDVRYWSARTTPVGMAWHDEGLRGGPAIGFKHALPSGLTVDLQCGLAYALATGARFSPLVNANAGWTF